MLLVLPQASAWGRVVSPFAWLPGQAASQGNSSGGASLANHAREFFGLNPISCDIRSNCFQRAVLVQYQEVVMGP